MHTLILVFLILLTPSAWAQKQSLSFEFGGDSNDTTNNYLNYSYQTQSNWDISIGAGASRRKSDRREAQSRQLNFDILTDAKKTWTFGGGFSYWGLRDHLTTSTLSASARWNGDNAQVSIKPMAGSVRLESSISDRATRIGTSSLGIEVDVDGWAPWFFGLNLRKYNYSKDPAGLVTSETALVVFSDNTLSLSQSLLDRLAGLYFGHEFKKALVRLQFTQAQAIIDESKTSTIALSTDYNLSRRWALYGTVGSTRITDWGTVAAADQTDSRSSFLTLGFVYSFGSQSETD